MENEEMELFAAAISLRMQRQFADRLMEVDAALTAQRFVLEQLLANAFIGNVEALNAFMAGLVARARSSATLQAPMSSEDKAEAQARTATQLLRIAASTRRRLLEDEDR